MEVYIDPYNTFMPWKKRKNKNGSQVKYDNLKQISWVLGILNIFTKSFAIFLRLLVKHNALELQFFPSKQFFRNVEEFGAKEYFTDHQTANTIQLFVAITGSFFWSILLPNKLQRRGIPSWVVDKCSHLFSKKYMDHMTQPLSSAAINFFFTGNQQILLY